MTTLKEIFVILNLDYGMDCVQYISFLDFIREQNSKEDKEFVQKHLEVTH